MAMKGYCTVEQVEAHLGISFTEAQTADCEGKIEAAETHFDEETGRGFLVGAQEGEAFHWPHYELWLRYAPVATVQEVRGRSGLGEAMAVLVEDEDYEVQELRSGLLRLVAPGNYDVVEVDYTPVDTTPADVRQAVVEQVAAWMKPGLEPGSFGLDSYSLPDLTVRYARSHVQSAATPLLARVIDRYRWVPVA